MGSGAHPEHAVRRVGDDAVRGDERVDGAPVPQRAADALRAGVIAQHRYRARHVGLVRPHRRQQLVQPRAARVRRRLRAHRDVLRIARELALEVVRERHAVGVLRDAHRRRRAGRPLHDGRSPLRVGHEHEVRDHHRLCLEERDRLVHVVRSLEHVTQREDHRLSFHARLSRPRTINDDGDPLRIHSGHHADEPRPGDAGKRDGAVLAHEEHGLVPIELVTRLEVERPPEQRMAVGGRARSEHERRAADERRVLEAERDVVERVEEDQAMVRRQVGGERIGLEPFGLRGELAPPRLGEAAIDVAVADAPHVHHERARGGDRNEVLEVSPERPLVVDHLFSEQPRVRRADAFGRPLEVHLADPPSKARVRAAEAEDAVLDDRAFGVSGAIAGGSMRVAKTATAAWPASGTPRSRRGRRASFAVADARLSELGLSAHRVEPSSNYNVDSTPRRRSAPGRARDRSARRARPRAGTRPRSAPRRWASPSPRRAG